MARRGHHDEEPVKGFVAAHRAPVMVGTIVVGIAALTFFTIRTGTGAKTARPPTTATTATAKGPPAELARLVDRGQAVNVDVAYTGTATTPATFTAHLWQRSPLARLDNASGSGDTAMRGTQLVTASGPLSCTQTGSSPWTCAPKPGLRIGDLGVVSSPLLRSLSALEVSVRDDRVLGQAVRCFTMTRPNPSTATTVAPTEVAEVCLTPDGVAVRVNVGPAHLQAVSLHRGRPPDSVFKPPA